MKSIFVILGISSFFAIVSFIPIAQDGSLQDQIHQLSIQIQKQNEVIEKQYTEFKTKTDFITNQYTESQKNLLGSLPVGSIVAFDRESSQIPSGWVLCNGSTISDNNSIYYGKTSPNLTAYFIRGKGSTESLRTKGGKDNIPGHYHTIPSHKHEVGSHTHSLEINSTSISASNSWGSSGWSLIVGNTTTDKFSTFLASMSYEEFENLTRHTHTGKTGNASSGYTREGGEGPTSNSSTETNIPEYIALNYILKII